LGGWNGWSAFSSSSGSWSAARHDFRKEKQFNRKVVINAELRDLKQELKGLIQ
jgi:hypothetical protein